MTRVFRAKRTSETLKMAVFIAVAVVLVILVYAALGSINKTQQDKHLEMVQDAVTRAVVQCYALESEYPPSLEYLAENYGLTLDREKFIYHYRTFGSNLAPEVRVFPNVPRGRSG